MHRRRRRRASLLVMATLLSSCSSSAHEWTTSGNCPARCASGTALCLASPQDGECVALTQTAAADEWRVALEDSTSYHFGAVALSPWVRKLELHGNKTRMTFDVASRWKGEHLTALLFIGLDLTNTSLPALPSSLTQVQIVDCVLNRLPVAWLLSLPRLETLVLANNTLTGERQMLMELSERQFKLLSSRLTEEPAIETELDEMQTKECTNDRGGRIGELNGWQMCVVPDEIAVARRLQTSVGFGSGGTQVEDTSDETDGSSSSSDDDHHTPTLVLLSMGLPFIYFLYKVALYIFFMRTYNRSPKESKKPDIGTANDSERDRPTANESTTSPPASPSPRVHRKQDKQPFSSNNAGFWVDEELQPWRLDFQRLKMLKCLNLLPSEKRQTLRKQSVTSAMNPREIWLASLAPAKGSAVAVSPGGGTTDTLVVAKFLVPKEDQGPRSSASGNGGGGASDKLKSELKRQAVFSHPQVVAFLGVAWSRETNLVAITEYMAQGDLRQWLHRTARQQSGKWTVLKVQMLLDVSRALLYLHSMQPRLVHGNCNSRNVLLDRSLRAKLSDFGVDSRADGLTEQELMSYSAVGSGRWISPEALLGRETSASYPDASDVYSFGILIAEMDSHELPFSDLMQANRSAVPETDILQLIARGALSPTLSPACPKSIVKLVNACTSYKPKYRPSSTQVQQDLLRILEDFRAIENNTTATISVGAPRSNPPSNLV
ncbi:TKL protein kinase [Phytophthora nicotianae]|uniref:TKL protein kinase n=4 Tax=Phytophthora nicotianae TaxID=4792 RepID=W2PJR6_PHYN3|nr:TKL protein kinase [Phytophthora nicotianae INRA-310]ETI34948.1 TKL protein kinase [Phytophthora nicotianae P1569]ETL81926.1 TKL protein kinase [Phytophthora nicotianae]ETO63733.1 TKL protein kinase [Phytophthora nicotianae P1976]KUF82140.1 serine/threonine-protein kinase [Phytophthora nicotianae]ETN01258.1 TKL protein kinase [Phytophthora nicotianae INRA-310]